MKSFVSRENSLGQGRYKEAGTVLRPLLDRKSDEAKDTPGWPRVFFCKASGRWPNSRRNRHRPKSRATRGRLCGSGWRVPWRATAPEALAAPTSSGFERAEPGNPGYDAFARVLVGDHDAASDRLAELVSAGFPQSYPLDLLGDVQQKQGLPADAAQSYQSALALRPYLLAAALGLVEVYHALNQPDRAQAALQSARDINAGDARVVAWRARIARS